MNPPFLIMRVAVIGPICEDINIIDGKERHQLGSPVYYIGEALTNLGVDTVLIASGNANYDELKSEIIRIPAETIQFVNEYIDVNTRKQRAVVPDNIISLENFPEVLNDIDYVVLAPLFHNNFSPDLIERLNKPIGLIAQGMIRYLDGDKIIWKHPENILNILEYVDDLIVDVDEFKFIFGDENFRKYKLKNLIVTNGDKGSKIYTKDEVIEIPAFKANVVDTTGAGDSYFAGFLACQVSPEERGKFASMTAVLCIENYGCFKASYKDVQSRIGKNIKA